MGETAGQVVTYYWCICAKLVLGSRFLIHNPYTNINLNTNTNQNWDQKTGTKFVHVFQFDDFTLIFQLDYVLLYKLATGLTIYSSPIGDLYL